MRVQSQQSQRRRNLRRSSRGRNRVKRIMSEKIPKQGEIWLADFNRKKEKENSKIRPVLILSNNWQNQFNGYTVVAPLTSEEEELKDIAAFEALIEADEKNGLDRKR